MTILLVFLWLLTALMMALAGVRFYEKATDDIKQVFHGCGGKKGVFLIVFLVVFILLVVVGSALRPTVYRSSGRIYLDSGGRGFEPVVKPLPTIQPTETEGRVLVPEALPIVKKPDTTIAPVENEGKVRQTEPLLEITRPADKRDKK